MDLRNKNKFKKFLMGTLVAVTLVASPVKIFAMEDLYPNTVYQFVEKENLGSGIVHENIKVFTTEGRLNINVLRIDATNKYAEIKGLINPDGLSNRDTVTNLVNKNKAVAGVNGDYFDYKPVPTSLGTLINDGQLISSPVKWQYGQKGLPTFYLKEDGDATVDYIKSEISLKNLSQSGKTFYIDNYNRINPEFPNMLLLDKNFDKKSVGNKFHSDVVEVLIRDNVVQSITVGWDPTTIPEDGYVLLGRGENANILKTLNPGDQVELDIKTTPDRESIKFAIGGGSIILKDGVAMATNIVDSSRHPRTGIGVSKDNSEIILMTVDGRVSTSRGITLKDFGQLFKKLGAEHAMNLDGGGSTSMSVKKQKEDKAVIVNKPSDKYPRKVVNAVGVYNKGIKGELDRVELKFDSNKMVMDSTNYLYLKGYDAFGDPVDIGMGKMEVEGIDFKLEGNVLSPKTTGKAKITGSYEKDGKIFKDTREIIVYDKAVDLRHKGKDIRAKSGSKVTIPDLYAVDKHGREAKVPYRNIDFTLDPSVGSIEGNVLTMGSKSGYLICKFKDGSEAIKIINEDKPEIPEAKPASSNYTDPLVGRAEVKENGFKLIVLSETDRLNKEQLNKLYKRVNESDVAISLNGFGKSFEENTRGSGTVKLSSNHGYISTQRGDLAIINMDSRKGSIASTNSYQLVRFKEDIKNRKESNIIITSHLSPDRFPDTFERRVLHETLVDLKNENPNKNIFFVHGGDSTGVRILDGIRYIGIDSRKKKPEDKKNNQSLMEFVVNGSDIKYSYAKVFQ